MAKFIQVDVGANSTAKDHSVWINLDHVTHFFSVPEEAGRPEMTLFKLAQGDTIASLQTYKSIIHTIQNSFID